MATKKLLEPGTENNGLIVIEEFKGEKRWRVKFKCTHCGRDGETDTGHFKTGHTKSCGCLHPKESHGQCHSITYASWESMIDRCYNPNADAYKSYGAKGISVSEEWKKYTNFARDMGERPSLAYSLDRIDGTKGYLSGNCRWATKKEQMTNRKNCIYIEWEGKRMVLSYWADYYNLSRNTVCYRYHQGVRPPELFSKGLKCGPKPKKKVDLSENSRS